MEQVAVPLELPCGWLDKEGRVHRDASIVAMTGAVRKTIARADVRSNPAKVIDTVLWSCCKQIGSVTKVSRVVTDELLVADRDFLVAHIRIISLGSVVTAIGTCRCGESLRFEYDLSKAPVKRLDDKCEVREVFGKKVRVFSITSQEHGYKAVFRYPNGADQNAIALTFRKNPVEANMRMYAACLVEWNGEPVEKVSPLLFEDMPLGVLDSVERQFIEAMPGLDLRETVVCSSCGAEAPMTLETSDFLFPLPRERRQSE